MIVLTSDETATGQRLDQWLAKKCQGEYSRARLQALIREGQLTINNIVIVEPKTKLHSGEIIKLITPPPQEATPQGENIALDVVFEDDDVIVINKPAGLVVHPGVGNWTGTLVNALIYHCGASLSGIGGVRRPGIVHRLDKDTSGIMVVAKNDHAHKHLSEQFADHGKTGALRRSYYALVWGLPMQGFGKIDAYLGRSTRDRTKQSVLAANNIQARHAVTHFSLIEKFDALDDGTALACLLECNLETGRTHQIRVHMAHIGHPLIGDKEYGGAFKTKANRLDEKSKEKVEKFSRQALHAHYLRFLHPTTNEIVEFSSSPPKDMQDLILTFQKIN